MLSYALWVWIPEEAINMTSFSKAFNYKQKYFVIFLPASIYEKVGNEKVYEV